MNTSLLKGSFTYAAVTILSRVAVIILIPVLTRIMSLEEYGAMNIMTTMVQLGNFIITLEIAQAVTVFYTRQTDSQRDYYPSTAIWFILFIYSLLIFFAIILLGAGFGSTVSGSALSPSLLVVGIFLMAANGFFALVQNQLRLEFKSTHYALVTLCYVVFSSLFAVLGAKYWSQPAVGVIGGQAIGATIASFITALLIKDRFRFGFKSKALKTLLKYSLPLVPASFFLIGSQQASKLILGYLDLLDQAGLYGLAMQVAGFSGLALIGVQTSITPSVLANHHLPETPKKLGKLFEIFFTISLLFCAGLTVFSKELILLFSTDQYFDAALYVPILSFAISLNGMYIFFPGKIINGKSASQLLASSFSFLVAIVLGFILVKLDGVRGATISTLFASATFFICWYKISQKLYYVPVKWLRLLLASAATVVLCFLSYYFLPWGFTLKFIFFKLFILLLFTILIGYRYLSEGINTYLAGPKK